MVRILKPLTVDSPYIYANGYRFSVGWVTEAIIRRLIKGPATNSQLVIVVYGYRDGPEDPRACIKVLVSNLRINLIPLGWTISKNLPGVHSSQAYELVKCHD